MAMRSVLSSSLRPQPSSALPSTSRPPCAISVSASRPLRLRQQQQQQPQQRDVRVCFWSFAEKFNAGRPASEAGFGSQGREDFSSDDVSGYFECAGLLADEGTYDRIEAMLKGRHPVDVILLLAAAENDTIKVQEVLQAGADPRVRGLDGRTPLELATKPEVQRLLQQALLGSSRGAVAV